MKKTLNINISGTVFHIDEDAYEILKVYLTKISRHFSKEEGGHEIINDIESRISELFSNKTIHTQKVVTVEMVSEIIEIMGLPEDFDDTDNTESHNAFNEGVNNTYYRKKKLYRDPDSRVFGGVCSGLSHYFKMDKALTRILFFILIILTQGAALLAYFILWIAVPKARTTSQRLEMKGEEINVENIGKSVKEEFSEMKENFVKYKNSEEYVKGKEYARKAGQTASNVGKETASVIGKVFGAIFLFVGFISLFGLVVGLLATSRIIGFLPEFLPGAHTGLFIDHVFSNSTATALFISVFIIVGIPLLLLIYAGTKLLFNYTSSNKNIILSSLGIWIIGIILAVTTSIGAVDVFSSDASISSKHIIESESDTLYITIDKTKFANFSESRFEVNNVMVMMNNDEEVLVSRPKFTIEQTSEVKPELFLRQTSKGNNYRSAKDNASKINFQHKIEGSKIVLDPYFLIDSNGKWRSQKVDITLKLPQGKVVFLNNNLLPIIDDIENTTNTWDGDMIDKYWVMKSEGLTLSN